MSFKIKSGLKKYLRISSGEFGLTSSSSEASSSWYSSLKRWISSWSTCWSADLTWFSWRSVLFVNWREYSSLRFGIELRRPIWSCKRLKFNLKNDVKAEITVGSYLPDYSFSACRFEQISTASPSSLDLA